MKGTKRHWSTFMQGDLVHFGVGQDLFMIVLDILFKVLMVRHLIYTSAERKTHPMVSMGST